MSDQAFHFCILFSLIYIERLGCVRGPQIPPPFQVWRALGPPYEVKVPTDPGLGSVGGWSRVSRKLGWSPRLGRSGYSRTPHRILVALDLWVGPSCNPPWDLPCTMRGSRAGLGSTGLSRGLGLSCVWRVPR